MDRKFCRDFNSYILFDAKFRKIQNTYLFQTQYDLATEYASLSALFSSYANTLFDDFGLGDEMVFYLNVDKITYLPFEKFGCDYINQTLENLSVADFKYEQIKQILREKFPSNDLTFVEEKVAKFFKNYYCDTQEVDPVGFATVALRVFHRLVTKMNLGERIGGMLQIQKEATFILKNVVKDVQEKKLKEIKVDEYLPAFEYEYANLWNNAMAEYLQNCLGLWT